MNVFDENGYPLGTIAPMNGHPNFENITFNISFYYDPLTSEMEIEIERNFGNQITHYSYSYEASEPISYMRVYIDGWQSQSYVSGEYHVSYDPVDIVPGSGSFVNKEDITLSLEKEGYALQEITLKNLRVSMEEDDVAYVLLNDREVLRFVDDWGGGVLYVFNEQGATLGTIEPVNGKPYYENILFDIRFAQIDSEMVYIFIEKRDGREVTKYQYGSVVLDEPITTLRLYMDGYQSGIDYITGKYESVYTPSLPQDETFLSFKNKESFIIHNEGSEIENLELKNFRVAMGIYDSASVYLNNFEILRFTDTPEGGILQILDEDGNVLDLISQVNGHPLHENVTFNVNFDKTESSLIMDIEKMKDGIVVDERSYDMDYETLIAYSHIYLFGYQSGANYIRSQYKVHGESDVLIFDNFVSSGSFALAQSVTIPLSTNAWTVPEVNLKNFRASMGAGDRAFIHINNHEILRFVDSSSGGTLHIFNENGQQLGTISRVNGKPTVENVTFNIDFIKTDSQVLIRIEKFSGGRPDGTFHYAYNSLNEFGEMRASIQGFQANVDYVSGDYEIKHKLKPHGEYELVLPRPDKPLHPNENMFLNENDISIDFDTLKSYPSEISITNFRTVPVEDMYVWISLNEMEIIGIYDEESRGTIEVNGPERYWMIRDVTSNVSWENVTFNILFTADLNRLNTVIEKMEHGELIDTYTYSFDYEEPIPIWNMRIEIEDYYQLGTGFFEGEISVNLSYYSETPYEPMEFGPDFITTFSYDSMDRIVQKTLPNGKIVDYFYNNQGLLEWIPGVIYNIDYNSMNLITKVEFANDVSTDLTYDSLTMRIANINTPGLQNLDYSFDEKGNVVGIADHILGENQYFFYDDLDRLLLAGSENYAQSFVYNPLGSILAHRSVDLATMDEIIFGFEFGNGAGIHAPTRVGEMDLFYDANGNLIEDEIFIYVYNDANRLVEVLKKDEDRVIAEFAYDATGSRFKKVENGVVSYYINQFFDVVNGEETVYYFANGDRIAKDSAEGRFWYLNDHLGSTNVMIDADGELVERTLYYPFGAQREGGEEKYSFTGKELDSEIGLYYFEARYYNSEIFVFTQADSFIPNVYNPQSLNRYAYCYNNPLRYTDPTGHAPHDEFPTLHAAVYDSAGYMVALAKETKFEHATYYYFENGFYSYADPWHSENNTSVNVHKADNLEHNISHQQKSLNIVAFSHTHPRVASFSSADGEWARYLKLDFYLFVETGPILVHQWETGDAPRLYYNHASQTFQTTPIVNSGSVSSGGVNSGSGSSSIWGSATTAVNNTVNTISNTFNKVISWFK
ncbi:MAG: RHS repeat-associated core domain-containing protein [Methanosarcinales archaeon]|jgi:RHS repeat-associated protein|nr:RHS repeat-associated core domain-containing protein [Methanosarcinales archaeon]